MVAIVKSVQRNRLDPLKAHTFAPVNQLPRIAVREYTVESFTREFLREVNFGQGVDLDRASTNDMYLALARTVRAYLMTRWLETLRNQSQRQAKTVAEARKPQVGHGRSA